MRQNRDYSLEIIDHVYKHVPAFTDIFDEETWYIFVFWFVFCTIIVFIILAKFIKLNPSEL